MLIPDNIYWHYEGALPENFCNKVIKFALNKEDKIARTGQNDTGEFTEEYVKENQKVRQSNLVWLDENWIYHTIQGFVRDANISAGWNFNWNWSEVCQFTKYNLNQYYDWHQDSVLDKNKKTDRKLSVTCVLNDPCEFEGGDLEFDSRNYSPDERNEKEHVIKIKNLKKGSVIVFPSFIFHRVKPITKGVRYSLVVWNRGPVFK